MHLCVFVLEGGVGVGVCPSSTRCDCCVALYLAREFGHAAAAPIRVAHKHYIFGCHVDFFANQAHLEVALPKIMLAIHFLVDT